jgi:thiamine biosynthesis lipoprotein
MKRYRYLPPVLIVCLILAVVLVRNLRTRQECYSQSAIMMDTVIEMSIWGEGTVTAEAAAASAFGEMARIESIFGDGIVDSESSHDVIGSAEFDYLIGVSKEAYGLTGGLFDPTIGSVSRLWHFWGGAHVPDPDSLSEALGHVGLERYINGSASNPVVFDVGGIAKGYAVDLATAKIRSLGFESAIINAGGDLRLIGRRPDGKPWRIAIRHPRRPGNFIGYLDLVDVAVATSGDYEKYFVLDDRRYHHILDPRTGMPGDMSESVTVLAESACLSDALATGLFVTGARRGLKIIETQPGLEAVFVHAEGETIAVSSGLAERFGRFESE